jgi:peptidyl-prolyl cis-trans isomerase B (cyclophilin B)
LAGKKDRERRRARERYERKQELHLQRRHKIRRRTQIGLAVIAVAGLAVGLTLSFAVGSGASSSGKPKSTASASASATPSASTVAEPAHHCAYTSTGSAGNKTSMPPATPDYNAAYDATINTNLGKVKINLLNSKATCSVNSFVHLASTNFWNGSQCHRMSNSGGLYILQCGDPTAKATTKLTCSQSSKIGSGGPGYEFASENLTGAKYKAGTLAMANSGSATSNGSQFFLVYKDTTLPAQYTPFGTITAGLDILQKVAKAGYSCEYAQSGGGAPKEKVIINSVTIKKT